MNEQRQKEITAATGGSCHRVDSLERFRRCDDRSSWLCPLREGIGGWVYMYCCASSSLSGEPGRDGWTMVDVGMRVLVVDWMISDASDSSW